MHLEIVENIDPPVVKCGSSGARRTRSARETRDNALMVSYGPRRGESRKPKD